MSQQGTAEIVKREDTTGAALARSEDYEVGISVEQLVARVKKVKAVQAAVMVKDVHYGQIPGVKKPSLLKPGAEILTMTFQLDPQFKCEDRWIGEHLEVVVTCTLYSIVTSARLGSGIGSCSTMETKYAYRGGERKCPECSKTCIIKGKEEFGGGWLCFAKKGGCGAKFKDHDKAITGQQLGRVANPDLPDSYNTVRKMACKRAHVAAVLFVTCASEIFTQDVEDMADKGHADDDAGHGGRDDGPPPSDRAPQRGNGQQRGQQQRSAGGSTRGGQQQGRAAAEPTEDFLKLAQLIREASDLEQLEELVPSLALARDEQSIALDEYKLLRSSYSARVNELKGTRASA